MNTPRTRIDVVKIGGLNATRLDQNVTTLDALQRETGGEIRAVVSALREDRGGFSTTDRLIAGAKVGTQEAALAAIQEVAEWTHTVEGVQENAQLQVIVENWRDHARLQITQVFEGGGQFEARILENGEVSSDWKFGDISLTGMGEELAAQLHNGLRSSHEFISGYRLDAGDERGYSDQIAARVAIEEANQGHEVYLHIQKPSAIMTADPKKSRDATLVTDLWHGELDAAFAKDGFAHGVIQESAYRLLQGSSSPINVLVYNPDQPDQVTTVHFSQSRPSQVAHALTAIAA